MSHLVRVSRSLMLVLVVLTPAGAFAQAPSAMPTCATLLTSAALTAAVGETFKDLGTEVARSGATECEWAFRLGTAGAKTLSVTFYDVEALKASPAYASADEYFESVVSGAERGAVKRETLPGVGLKAAFVATTPQSLVVVQRADGVARVVGNNISKPQMTAIAQAMAAR